MTEVHRDELVDAFSDCVGREKARDIVTEVASDIGLDGTESFSQEEAIDISVRIANQQDATTYIRTAATTVQSRIQTGHI